MADELPWQIIIVTTDHHLDHSLKTMQNSKSELPKVIDKDNQLSDAEYKAYIEKTSKLDYLAGDTQSELTYTVTKAPEANANQSSQHTAVLAYIFHSAKKRAKFCIIYGGLDLENP